MTVHVQSFQVYTISFPPHVRLRAHWQLLCGESYKGMDELGESDTLKAQPVAGLTPGRGPDHERANSRAAWALGLRVLCRTRELTLTPLLIYPSSHLQVFSPVRECY